MRIRTFAVPFVTQVVSSFGGRPTLRGGEARAFKTDEGNSILDCAFDRIDDPEELSAMLNATPGVVEHGLFLGVADIAIVGRGERTAIFKRED